jgi:hypothetical protein
MNLIYEAANPNTTPERLAELATDENWSVRECVARNPNTPAKTLEQLATDEDSEVRYWVANNPNTSHFIKKSLKTRNYLSSIVLIS